MGHVSAQLLLAERKPQSFQNGFNFWNSVAVKNEHDRIAASHNRYRIWCAVNGSDIIHLKPISRIASIIYVRRTSGENWKTLRRPKKLCRVI